MVDGVLAYCYASADYELNHLLMIPMLKMPEVMKWIFGDDAGLAGYVSTARHLGMLLLLPTGHFLDLI